MQIIGADRSVNPRLFPIFGGALAGTVLIVAGLTMAYATFATPYIARIAGGGRFGGGPDVAAIVGWCLAVLAMATFLGVGAARLAAVLTEIRPKTLGAIHRLGADVPDDVVMALRVDIGDGRPIPELLIGRFGAAVVREMPPASELRRHGPYWEGRVDDAWVRIENPLDRTARDAERVRRWLTHDDNDFVVKVYAAVMSSDPGLPRTPTCAVITETQLAAWLKSLPNQRSLTDPRRARLVQMVRAAI